MPALSLQAQDMELMDATRLLIHEGRLLCQAAGEPSCFEVLVLVLDNFCMSFISRYDCRLDILVSRSCRNGSQERGRWFHQVSRERKGRWLHFELAVLSV